MDYYFIFKKAVSAFLTPLAIGLEAIAAGLLLAAFSSWHRKKSTKSARCKMLGFVGISLILLGTLFLYLCSISPVTDSLLYALEKQYPPLIEKKGKIVTSVQPQCIVVLAGGAFHSRGVPILSNLTDATLARVTQAVLFWKKFPDTEFIVTGGEDETSMMAKAAASLGVNPEKIVKESASKDTKDHAINLKPIIAGRPFLLVTSAIHMPRSVALFRAKGHHLIPAPCQFQAWPKNAARHHKTLVIDALEPSSKNLFKTKSALHEYFGIIWARLRGQIVSL